MTELCVNIMQNAVNWYKYMSTGLLVYTQMCLLYKCFSMGKHAVYFDDYNMQLQSFVHIILAFTKWSLWLLAYIVNVYKIYDHQTLKQNYVEWKKWIMSALRHCILEYGKTDSIKLCIHIWGTLYLNIMKWFFPARHKNEIHSHSRMLTDFSHSFRSRQLKSLS